MSRRLRLKGRGIDIAVARSLKMDLVAEGVETRDQANFLTERACKVIQGFIISRPVPADEFLALLKKHATGVPADVSSVIPFSRGKHSTG